MVMGVERPHLHRARAHPIASRKSAQLQIAHECALMHVPEMHTRRHARVKDARVSSLRDAMMRAQDPGSEHGLVSPVRATARFCSLVLSPRSGTKGMGGR